MLYITVKTKWLTVIKTYSKTNKNSRDTLQSPSFPRLTRCYYLLHCNISEIGMSYILFAGSIAVGVSGFFIDIKSFRSHYGLGVDSASNRNEYQEHFPGGKGGRCVRLTTYHHPVQLSRNLGTLTFWNPLGLFRPVTGMLYLYIYI